MSFLEKEHPMLEKRSISGNDITKTKSEPSGVQNYSTKGKSFY